MTQMERMKTDFWINGCMKRMCMVVGIQIIVIASFAQSSNSPIRSIEKTIGEIFETREGIKAKEYIFPERIFDSYMDTISKFLVVQLLGLDNSGKKLKNRGEILIYDVVGEKVKWSQKLSYQKSRIHRFGGTIIHTKTGIDSKTVGLNIETGKKMWQVNHTTFFVDPVTQVGVGYTGSGQYDNTLEGVDLKNGKALWRRELTREYGWNNVLQLNDSLWMLVAAGLHTVNIRDGSGWDHHAVTGKKDYRVTNAVNAAGVTLGLLTGTFVLATGHNLVSHVNSNVHSDSTGFYFASKEKISRIRKDEGSEFWWRMLPADLPSKSSIFVKSDTLFMVNFGYAFMGNRQINFGTPFFAAFDKETGNQIFFHTINNTKNPILDFKVENEKILLIFKDGIIKRSMRDGAQEFERTYNTDEYGELRYFVGNQIYAANADSSLTSLTLTNPSKKYIFTTESKVLELDNDFNITDKIDFDQLYLYYLEVKDYKFVAKNNKTVVLDADNNRIAEIDVTRRSTLIGNKLYDMQEKSFFEVDLSNLIGQ